MYTHIHTHLDKVNVGICTNTHTHMYTHTHTHLDEVNIGRIQNVSM